MSTFDLETLVECDGAANLAFVVGTLSSPARSRELPSGSVLVNLEVTTASAPRETVPVTAFDPPRSVADLAQGDAIAVVGRVRRRFYRAGGTTRSRTEVVADRVARVRNRRSRAAVLAQASERVAGAAAVLG